jgi:hypothetical protein
LTSPPLLWDNKTLNKKVIVSVLIIAVWLSFLALKMKNYYKPPQDRTYLSVQYTKDLGAQENAYGIYLQERRIGSMKRWIIPGKNGYKVFEEGIMKIRFFEEKTEIRLNLYTDVDESFRLRNFVFQMSSNKEEMNIKGEMAGSFIQIHMITKGKGNTYMIPMKEPPVVSSTILPYMLKKGFAQGATVSIPLFDPATMSRYDADVAPLGWEKVRIDGEAVRAFHVRTVFKGVELHAWVDEAGVIVKELSPLGLVIQKESGETAEATFFDTQSLSSVETKGTIGNPRAVTYMKARIDTRPELVSVIKKFYYVKEGYLELQAGASPLARIVPADFLGSSVFINSDDREIKQFLRTIVKPEMGDREKVVAIKDWVYKNIKKIPTFSVPTARDVFRTRAGDCNEHAVLFAALARAAHIPCLIVSGMAYSSMGGFYYHAWNLIYLEGKWVEADSTFGEFPADATHIILALGDISDGIEIIPFLKNIKIEVVASR